MASEYHEPVEELTPATREMNRAIRSLIEELEAVDWYQHRVDATNDAEIRAIVLHNRNEEIEHACMLLEWLRRNVPEFDENLRTYLFTEAPITEVEEIAESQGAEGDDGPQEESGKTGHADLGIGNLKH